VQPLILSSLATRLPRDSYTIVTSASAIPSSDSPTLHIRAYEQLPFEDALANPESCLANAYTIRKALIRKNYLLVTVQNWISKHPSSILATNVKPSCDFELDYAEFLDDALVEAWELQASFRHNEDKDPSEREWWILKPGMSDRGQGIRLFSTQEELQAIFDEWEAARPDSDDEGEDKSEDNNKEEQAGKREPGDSGDYIMTSHLRHFIAQPYIHPPLLLPLPNDPSSSLHKFHIRTYVLAVGSLKVYVYKPMLALFASMPYSPPWISSSLEIDLSAHLTNTCFQYGSTKTATVQLFWSLPSPSSPHPSPSSPPLPKTWKDTIFTQICTLTGEVFEAAARSMSIHFQTLPNAFEVFGLDFLVDEQGKAWLLEVNAFPDFGQTGDELKSLVGGLWEGVVDCAVRPFFGIGGEGGDRAGHEAGKETEENDMMLVRELDLGRR
jgi:tubulin---tyrosine ligase